MADAKKRGRGLTRDGILREAVTLADAGGIDSLAMRKLGRALGVEAMSLYNHVAGKDDLLDGMLDLVWSEIRLSGPGGDWRSSLRSLALSAYDVLRNHPWACELAMSPSRSSAARLRYMETILSGLREAGFSAELTYHAYHALDSHVIGFTLWEAGHSIDPQELPRLVDEFVAELAADHPHLAEHAQQHLAGVGGAEEGEFAFVLDLLLEGLEHARSR